LAAPPSQDWRRGPARKSRAEFTVAKKSGVGGGRRISKVCVPVHAAIASASCTRALTLPASR